MSALVSTALPEVFIVNYTTVVIDVKRFGREIYMDVQDRQDGGIPLAPLRCAKGEVLNHDCRDGVMIAMISPSLPLWILAFARMTGIRRVHPPGPLRGAKGGFVPLPSPLDSRLRGNDVRDSSLCSE